MIVSSTTRGEETTLWFVLLLGPESCYSRRFIGSKPSFKHRRIGWIYDTSVTGWPAFRWHTRIPSYSFERILNQKGAKFPLRRAHLPSPSLLLHQAVAQAGCVHRATTTPLSSSGQDSSRLNWTVYWPHWLPRKTLYRFLKHGNAQRITLSWSQIKA